MSKLFCDILIIIDDSIMILVLLQLFMDLGFSFRRSGTHPLARKLLISAVIALFWNLLTYLPFFYDLAEITEVMVLTLVIWGLFSVSISTALLYCIVYYVGLNAFAGLCTSIFSLWSWWDPNDTLGEMTLLILGEALWIGLFFTAKTFLGRIRFERYYRFFILLVGICSVILYYDLIRHINDSDNVWLSILCFLLIVMMLVVVLATRFRYEVAQERFEKDHLQLQINALDDKYRQLQQIYHANAMIYHDLRHDILELNALLDAQDMDQARQYLQKMGTPINSLKHKQWTGITLVDVVLNAQEQQFRDNDIDFSYDLDLPEDSGIDAHDLARLLSNILTNAGEAALQCDQEKKLRLKLRTIHHMLLILCENSCKEGTSDGMKNHSSTKSDRLSHGWGSRIIEEITKKYNGSMNFYVKDDSFHLEIMLFF